MPGSASRFVVGNWKMHGLSAALGEVEAIAAGLDRGAAEGVRCAICPPATLIDRAVARAGARLLVGAQDCAAAAAGAHTGDLSAEMLRDAGARLVIVGHSERRADHGETDAQVRAKVRAAHRAGLTALVCVGETRTQRDAGDAQLVVGRQLSGSLPDDMGEGPLMVAYEPVWAIGTGLVPGEPDIERMHGFIRERLRTAFGARGAGLPILYGGSVKPDNAGAILRVEHVDGALVGGASLKAADFLAIASASAGS